MTNTAVRGTGPSKRKPASKAADNEQPTGLDPHQVELLVQGRHYDPHSLLGRHGGLVRAFRPAATEMFVIVIGPGPDRPVLRREAMHRDPPRWLVGRPP